MLGFPDSDIDLQVQAAFGADLTAAPSTWEFTDLTVDGDGATRLLGNPITIRRATTAGGTNQQTTTCNGLQLLNNDGWLTPHHAGSPYWPYVDAGTPIRVGVRYLDPIVDTFGRTVSNGWGAAESGHVWEPTPGSESAFSVASGQAKITFPAVNVSRAVRTFHPFRDADVTFDASMTAVQTGAASIIGPQLRRANGGLTMLFCTVEFNVGGTISLRVRRNLNSTTPVTLANVVVPSLTYSGGTMIRCRVRCVGSSLKMRAWLASGSEPVTWPVDITQTDVLTPGDSLGVQASVFASNTNTMPAVFSIDNLRVDQVHTPKVEGYITDVRPVFLPQADGTTWSTVMIDIGGVGSRLERQASPEYSPMRRSIQQATLPPIAYWPLEDATGSTYGVSAFPGGPKMTVTGPAVFSFDQGTPSEQYLSRYGTKPLVSVAAGAKLSAPVPLSTVTNEWAVSLVAEFYEPDVPGITEMRIAQWDTPSSVINRWALVATNTGYVVRGYNDANATVTNVATYLGVFQGQATYTVEASQSGGNIAVDWFVNDNLLASGTIAGTMAPVARVTLNPDQVNTTNSVTPAGLKFVVGHARVVDEVSTADTPFYVVPETGTVVTAIKAWFGEPAHRRIKRLCDEERVPCLLLGDPATTGYTVLNAQQEGGFTGLLQSAADSESGGLLYEIGFGYAYLPRTARYNAPVDLTVDLATYCRSADTDQGDVLVPQLESRAANYWTVRRPGGAEGSYAADAAYRARRGTIAQEAILDVLRDADTDLHAQWRVHVGSDARDAHYPSLPLDLAANPDLIAEWDMCAPGSRIQRVNRPAVSGSGPIDQVIEGWSEKIGPRVWSVEADASPASVWDVAVYGQAVYSPSQSTLQAGISTSATSMSVGGETWVTGPVSLLLDVEGEHIAVSNISGSGPYTMTISARSVNGVTAAHSAGAKVLLANPDRYGL